MASGLEELAAEANSLVGQATGAGSRFEEACRRTAARDLRGRRKAEVEAFLDEAHATVKAAKEGPTGGNAKDRRGKDVLVFMSRESEEGGPYHVGVSVEFVESRRMKDLIGEKESYALPEDMFWDFAEWFKDGMAEGTFDFKGEGGERIPDIIYSEFKGASKSWMERKGWDGLSSALKGVL